MQSDYPSVDVAGVSADISALHAANDIPTIETTLLDLSDSVSALANPICAIAQYEPALSWQPTYSATLAGEPISYTLTLENRGPVTTTYAITVNLPAGATTLNETLAPASSQSFDFNPSTATLGRYTLSAIAAVTNPEIAAENIAARANAVLNVVDRYIQLTRVLPTPDLSKQVSAQATS